MTFDNFEKSSTKSSNKPLYEVLMTKMPHNFCPNDIERDWRIEYKLGREENWIMKDDTQKKIMYKSKISNI